uniref:Bifunctional inhibitor/plant lipid transfer protein/seed storage helical domain-containing protein n=1 Tax=Brassica oleracea var. oleracea TaxID=109376 RepID=A0A0D3E4P0_BRAOL
MATATMIFAAAMTAMILVSLQQVEAQPATTCVNKLVPCFSALTTTTKPPKDCCDSIKEAVEDELPCLCTVYNTPGLLSQFNVSTAQALNLSRRCDVTTDLSACSVLELHRQKLLYLLQEIEETAPELETSSPVMESPP